MFAAHDIGGANMLAPVMPLAIRAGHEVFPFADGPALAAWRGMTAKDCDKLTSLASAVGETAPDLIITGTSRASEMERSLWRIGIERGVTTIAVIDSWVNFHNRFIDASGAEILPDAICVIDEWCRRRIEAEGWCGARIHVVGHPHLQERLGRTTALRKGRTRAETPRLTFFSEPIREVMGFAKDQFWAAGEMVRALGGIGPACFTVKPHPTEKAETWRRWRDHFKNVKHVEIEIAGEDDAEALFIKSDVVTGIHSIALIEANFLGIPVITMQPDGPAGGNPRLDTLPGVTVASNQDELGRALKSALAGGDIRPDAGVVYEVVNNAGARLLSAIEKENDA